MNVDMWLVPLKALAAEARGRWLSEPSVYRTNMKT